LAKKKIIVLSILAFILLGVIFIPGYLKLRRLTRQNREFEKQIEEIKQANMKLKEEQQKLISDPLYLEEVAREKFGVVRKGEVVYKVLPPQQKE
jgi:cell division protein FtsB